MTRLNEYTKAEWFDVGRRLKPDLTWEEFETMWADHCAKKAERERARKLH
ncbi:MAG: hypothetical protein WA961_14505 [Rhodanobacter sp.]